MSPLLMAWGVEAGIVTWRAFRSKGRPPVPGDFVATFVLFGALGALAESESFRPAAAITGWGIVLATVLNLGPFGPGNLAGGPAATTAPAPAHP